MSKHSPLVGIGASAGGIEAMNELLENLSADTGMAFIYIQHLDPDHQSNLVSIFQRKTQMEVVTAEDKMSIQPNTIYVIPPNKEISVIDHIIFLTNRPSKPIPYFPVNFLFFSMAENYDEQTIGIVLSGMASDGALGLKAIKQAGGITYAQDSTARYESMPRAAIAEGSVDSVLSPKEIALDLVRLSKSVRLFDNLAVDDSTEETEPEASPKEAETNELNEIFKMLRSAHAVDFTHYKKSTINRRIIRRLLLHKLESIKDYVAYLKRNPDEISNLFQDLLINVTHFFRDADASDYLKHKIFPRLLKNKSDNEPLRIWVAACSTGEEAYSMAMILHEVLGDIQSSVQIQIFATDLSEIAIAKARVGIFSADVVQLISEERLRKFFTKVDGHYRINKAIRDICIFAPHNIFKDPPFSRVDIISCCNLFIYLNNILQQKIIANFHYALNKNGYLVLGQSETIGSSQQYFSQVEKSVKIYSKKNDISSRALFDINLSASPREIVSVRRAKSVEANFSDHPNLERLVDKMILTSFSPAGVVVNSDLDIIQFRGSTSLFLEPAPGQASLNLVKMARSGLAFELRNAATEVFKTGEAIRKSDIEITYKGNVHKVSFNITPVEFNGESNLLFIVFEEAGLPVAINEKGKFSKDRRVKQLENELQSLREDMRSILESQEAANEELQSANEEILSSNEELQSINEELETSKEEIESTNEELITINQELIVRNDQLAESNSYSEAVIETIRESVLILDGTFMVKAANKRFYQTFKTNEKNIVGKLVFELGNGDWHIPALKNALEDLGQKNSSIHGLEIQHEFEDIGIKTFLVNLKLIAQPINNQKINLLAFEDITEDKEAARLVAERESWLRNMVDSVPVMVWVAGPDKNYTYVNKTWLQYTGRTLEKEIGIGWTEGIHADDIKNCLSAYHEAYANRTPFSIEYRMQRHDGQHRWVLNTTVPTYNSQDVFTGYLGSVIEIHDKKLLTDELERLVEDRTQNLRQANLSLEKSNNELQQFAYIASHDLQEPLRKIVTFSERLKEKQEQQALEDSRGYIDKIIQASKRMINLIDDLLDFSQVTSEKNRTTDVDLNVILKSVVNDFELAILEKKAEIKMGSLPKIEGIPLQLSQLFFNLLGNALKFTNTGAVPIIDISCRKLSVDERKAYRNGNDESDYYEIIFKDQGIGFHSEFAEQIFVIFQRLNDRQRFEGTGIGLALCKKIVENHAGKILARSNGRQGAEFIIILPEKQPVKNNEGKN